VARATVEQAQGAERARMVAEEAVAAAMEAAVSAAAEAAAKHAARCEAMEAAARGMVEQARAAKAERPRVAAGRSGGERGVRRRRRRLQRLQSFCILYGGADGSARTANASRCKLSLGLPPLAPAVKPDGRRLSVSWTQAALLRAGCRACTCARARRAPSGCCSGSRILPG
jgi:hypothetical protein